MPLLRAAALILAMLCARPAVAEDAAPDISAGRRGAAVVLSVVPGVVVRGAGSLVAGESRTGKRLLWMAGLGLGAMIVGFAPSGLSGASAYAIWPAVPIGIAGTGVLMSSWLGDIWTAAGGANVRGVRRLDRPWSVELGSTWLRDGLRGDRVFARVGARGAVGPVEVGAVGWLDVAGQANEGVLEARVRVIGDLIVRPAVRARRDDEDHLSSYTGEIEASMRIELDRVDRALGGTFLDLSTGLGLEGVHYDSDGRDWASHLLGGFAWGAYLGDRGETYVYYQHRRDSLAGGIDAARAAGFLGSFGAVIDGQIHGPWAAHAELQVGAAWVTTLGIRYEGGSR